MHIVIKKLKPKYKFPLTEKRILTLQWAVSMKAVHNVNGT